MQYRNPLNFNPDTLKSAQQSLKRIDRLVESLQVAASSSSSSNSRASGDLGTEHGDNSSSDGEDQKDIESMVTEALRAFEAGMCDDMNTPRASAALFSLVGAAEKALKKGNISQAAANLMLAGIRSMDEVFGVMYDVPASYFAGHASTTLASDPVGSAGGEEYERVMLLATRRAELKSQKMFAEADAIRAEISDLGYEVKDSKGGFEVKRKE